MVSSATYIEMGRLAKFALVDETEKQNEINRLEISGSDGSAYQIRQDEQSIDHDDAVIHANDNLLELFHVQLTVMKDAEKVAEKLAEEHAADIAADNHASASKSTASQETIQIK